MHTREINFAVLGIHGDDAMNRVTTLNRISPSVRYTYPYVREILLIIRERK